MDKDSRHPNEPKFITRKRNETPEEIQEMLRLAKHQDKLKEERTQLFVILWIGLGLLFSALSDQPNVFHWVLAVIISGIYAYGFHKK